jgi:hypothetical protein
MLDLIPFAIYALAPLMTAAVVFGVRDIMHTLKMANAPLPAEPKTSCKALINNNFAFVS